MKILEQFIASKIGDPARCEDGLFIGDHYIAVIDGVTAKGQISWDGKTSGYCAKEIIIQALRELTGGEERDAVFQRLNAALRSHYADRDFFKRNPEERLQATIVIYSVDKAQIWRFGDCQYLIDDAVFRYEMKIDALLAELRSVYLTLEILRGKTIAELCAHDPSHEIIYPILKRQFFFSNTHGDYGFQVLDGFCDDFSAAEVRDVPAGSIVVLASDGYPELRDSLAESEQFLANLRLSDPLCIGAYKSTRGFTDGKSSLDDRAYIKIST